MKDYILAMKTEISKIMNVGVNVISIKATTTEYLGFIGREEGIAAQVVVLLRSKKL